MNLVSFLTFELACKRLSPPSQISGHVLINYSILTPTIPRHNNLLLQDNPNCAELASFLSAQPQSAAATTTLPLLHVRILPKEEVVAPRQERVQRREQEVGEKGKKRESTLPCRPPTPPAALAPGPPQAIPKVPHPPKCHR